MPAYRRGRLEWQNVFIVYWINFLAFINLLSNLRFATAKAFSERGKASAGKHSIIKPQQTLF